MTDWLGTFLDICTLRGDMLFQPLPAWVWARDGSAILWANPAGADILGAENLDQISRLSIPVGSALSRDIANVARRLGQAGTLARLRFFKGARSYSLACRCERMVLPDGQVAIWIDAKEGIKRQTVPDNSAMAAYLSFGDYDVAILDSQRQVLAGGNGELDGSAIPDLSDIDGSRSAEMDIGDIRARIRFAETGANSNGLVLTWIERLADPAAASQGEGDELPADDTPVPDERGRMEPLDDNAPDNSDVALKDSNASDSDKGAESSEPSSASDHVTAIETDDAAEGDGREPDIGRPKMPAGFVDDGDSGGDFSRQARMLRAALKKSTEPAVDYEQEPADVLVNLPKKPVRFLWQTDSEDRFLFVSPGLEQLVGRSSQIVGERWDEIADRMRLDPVGRVGQALAGHDTWSGYTAWWPTDDRAARIPAELTALPVFAIDQSFQGYRGFGVLKPAEAMSAAAFDRRFPGNPLDVAEAGRLFGDPDEEADNSDVGSKKQNVVPIREEMKRLPDFARLSPQERSAFDEIAQALKTHDELLAHSVAPEGEFRTDAKPAGSSGEPDPSTDGQDIADGEWGEYSTDANDPYFLASLPDDDDDYQLATIALSDGEGSDVGREGEVPDPSRHDAAAKQEVHPDSVDQPSVANEDQAATRTAASGDGRSAFLKSSAELQSLLDITADGILVLDGSGNVVRLNAIAQAVFGDVDDSLVGRHLSDLFSEDSRQSVLDYLDEVRDSGAESVALAGREVSVPAGTDIIPLYMKIGPLIVADGDYENEAHLGVVIRDISRWKNVEADLIAERQAAEQASEQKSEFLARVSHEIRTPLNAIIGFAEVMIEERFGPVENERYGEYLRDIRMSGEHVVSLVNDLLDISKIEAGKLDLTFAAVPLNDLVRECVTLMQPQANQSKVIVRSSLAGQLPSIVADQRTMRQVVLNLLSNSIKFTGAGGQVIVSTSLTDRGEALLRVRDTGSGMSEEDLARALEPFRQLSTTRIGSENGTGLGLPLTKALVESNRAVFDISSAKGEGTVVQITFPAARVVSV